MLLDRARSLQADLQAHEAIKSAGAQAQVFKSRASQFAPLAQDLKIALETHAALAAAGLDPPRPAAKPALRAQAADILARFEADRTALAQADEKLRFEFTLGVKNTAAEVQEASRQAWTDFAAARANLPSEDVLQALDQVAAYREAVRKVRAAAQKIQQLRDTLPAPDQIPVAKSALEAGVRELEEGLATLQGDELPKGVLAFLRKSGQGGAALEDLTSEVRSWLEQRGLSASFRIVAVRST